MPRLLYIGQAPSEGTGSPVILKRHLERLTRHGWQVSVLPEWGNDTRECRTRGWETFSLPHREVWWPPLPIKNEWTRRMAVRLWALWLKRNLSPKPDAVLCYLAWHSDLFCEIAAAFGRTSGIPVTCIVHDDATDFEGNQNSKTKLRRRQARILSNNHCNWFVSPQQAMAMAPRGASAKVLPPIPAGNWPQAMPQWRPAIGECPAIHYAGYLWPAQARLLRQLAPVIMENGAKLVIQGRTSPEVSAMVKDGLAEHRPLFPTNQEALEYLGSNAAALLVSYAPTTEELAWSRTSMPSKLIEYAFLGIPIALVAPKDTAVMQWAARRSIRSAFTTEEVQDFGAWIRSLREVQRWTQLRDEWKAIAEQEWNPDLIQDSFEAGLLRK